MKKKKEEFAGGIDFLNPSILIEENKDSPLDNFFLVLATIYNDLKGYTLFSMLMKKTYRLPNEGEITYHAGEYGGIMVQINKLIVATIHEIFEFLSRNSEILNSAEFNEILKEIPEPRQKEWEEIVQISNGQIAGASNFAKSLKRVRHNFTFHYYDAGKNLKRGFVQKFFKKEVGVKNKNQEAYLKFGSTIGSSRFCYADAAVEEAMRLLSSTPEIKDWIVYRDTIIGLNENISKSIYWLLKKYINRKGGNF